jgi:outer membrane receptor protein involved in Fe transport
MPVPLTTAIPFHRAGLACGSGLAALTVLASPALGSGLEEIVVTAQRQPVIAIATPLSIERVGTDSIRLVGATHSSEVLNRVAGTMVQRGSGQESLTAIRSPVLTGAGSCGAFLFLENSIPIRPVGFCNVNELLEVNTEQADAIEVLRGTGTALQGSNAVHGMVNVLQDAPATLPDWRLGLGAGPDDYWRTSLVAARDGQSADAAIKALYTHDGGWRDDSGFDEGKLNATLALGAGSTLPARIDLAATLLDQETAGFITGKDA